MSEFSVRVEHAGGESAYGYYGHNFASLEEAVTYLTEWGNPLDEDGRRATDKDWAGTIHVFESEYYANNDAQPTMWEHEGEALYVVTLDGSVTKM